MLKSQADTNILKPMTWLVKDLTYLIQGTFWNEQFTLTIVLGQEVSNWNLNAGEFMRLSSCWREENSTETESSQ